jgi:hypothetical protein
MITSLSSVQAGCGAVVPGHQPHGQSARSAERDQFLVEGGKRAVGLDRVPQHVGPARKPPRRSRQPVDHPVILAGFLEGRVDQHQAAFLLWRQMRAERQPAVEFDDPHLVVPFEHLPQPFGVFGMQFDRCQPVLLAQKQRE